MNATASQRTTERRTSSALTRVFLVEANELTLAGLRQALEAGADLCLAGAATSVTEATSRLLLADPDVVVVDLNLPDACGTSVLSFLRARRAPARRIALTATADDAVVAHAVAAGADAVVTTRIPVAELTSAIRSIAAGRPLTDQLHRDRIDELARAADHDEHLARLTHQEHALLAHLARGLTNREIAEAMGLSDKTVKNYVSSVMMKLDVSHRAAAAAYFARAEAQLRCSPHEATNGNGVIRY